MSTIDLATRHWGSGTRTALLLHGITSNGDGWWRLGPDLAAAGYSVTAPDLRGHGASPYADDYRLGSYAADVLALGQRWDLVIGHSLGGAVAVLVAADHPHWAGRLVLEDPALRLSDTEAARAWLLESYDGPITPKTVAAGSPGWHPEDYRHKAAGLIQSGPAVVSGTIDDNQVWDVTAALARVTIPTLLIGADPDGAVATPEVGEAAVAANPNVAFVVVPGSGHSIHRDSYEAFLEALGPLS